MVKRVFVRGAALCCAMIAVIAPGARAGTVTYRSYDVPKDCVDGDWTISSIDVPATGALTDVNLLLDDLEFTLGAGGYLTLMLKSPEETNATPFRVQNVQGGYRFTDAVLDYESTQPLGSSPYTGVRHGGELDRFYGGEARGSWELSVWIRDGSGGATGTITRWGLQLGFEGDVEEEYNCSLCVPWFMDNAGAAQGMPARDGGITVLIFLHNNLGEDITCAIEYYTRSGVYIGPMEDKTFSVPANATIAFRPVADDPSTTLYGQEGPEGNAVPDRPRGTANGNDDKMNGSIVIRWYGAPDDVQGMIRDCQKSEHGEFATTTVLPAGRLSSGKAAAASKSEAGLLPSTQGDENRLRRAVEPNGEVGGP